jgi:thiol-disulfide isomerase/thioredoxin
VPERRGLAAALLALALFACGSPPAGDAGADAADAPASLVFLDGSRAPLASLRGDWVFVNYWAEWCKPCLEEIPELNALHVRVDGARVIGINFDALDPEAMRPQVASLGIDFPVAIGDAGAALAIEPPEVLPSTYVFAPDGSAAGVLRGPQTLEDLRAAMGAAGEVAAGGR